MSNECIDVERIGEVLELPPDDELRLHVERCPRCSSLLASYQAFIVSEPADSANPADAETRLMEFLHRRIGNGEPSTPPGDPRPGDGGFLARLKAAVYPAPAWVAAALVVAAAVAWWQPWKTSEPPVLRSVSRTSFFEISEPEPIAGGAVRLEWEASEAADAYQVVLYNQDLEEVARLDAGTETSMDLTRGALPKGAPKALICRIAALKDGDEIAESAPVPVNIP
ncbi:MAG: hypothetical protein PVF33_05530 [Candidatus Latescibacterota bacterium]|jgi:hypothetical protein